MHQVYLAGRDNSFAAGADEPVLEAGLRQHLTLPFGCKSGGCGSCRVRLLQGEVQHRVPPPALSQAELDAGYILMCLAEARSDLVLDLHQPARLERLRPRQLPVRAQARTPLSHDVIGLTLKLPRGESFDYVPGQYLDFLLEDGKRRSFSIASAPNGETLELHLRIAPGGRFAQWVRDQMPDRAILRIEGPLGAFYLREDSDRPMLLMAGGTGFAPIKAMLEDQLARGLKRPAHLFWGVRCREDLYLDALARRWAEEQPLFQYTPVLSDPDAGWPGERGFVHEALLRAYPRLDAHEVYMSGPPVMVRSGKDAFTAAGLDPDHLFYDSFDYAFETWPTQNPAP
ncbi:2Fe-2S iron-sulfur cluster-binding protein [Solimonas sp. SE-A11]|uniref:2Fe-2S iron-sulfur cluster-binding protein n=1 Tax=Solimonas sp. SE-A11 TaxID=3054954 RepID=UPI00259CF51E|nr:2Fe-2S iron-sulfur cluster-binding protein [Solimonas sp. SE-A11]MDM4772664.1 2Fe-2S iron-sulfur cluster-binding protein [Solimonas sp. SE-A11]